MIWWKKSLNNILKLNLNKKDSDELIKDWLVAYESETNDKSLQNISLKQLMVLIANRSNYINVGSVDSNLSRWSNDIGNTFSNYVSVSTSTNPSNITGKLHYIYYINSSTSRSYGNILRNYSNSSSHLLKTISNRSLSGGIILNNNTSLLCCFPTIGSSSRSYNI